MQVPRDLIDFISEEDVFFIATHINPEGDALGSSIALSMALESIGKETTVFDRDGVPEPYTFLPGHERVVRSPEVLISDRSALVLIDCNEPLRAGLDMEVVARSAVIDHHETEKSFGSVRWIEPRAAATGVMVYHLIKELGVSLTKDMAINLYTALAIDTGTFRYNNTSSGVLRVAAELVDLGADPASIAEGLYEAWSTGRFRLLIDVLNTLEINDGVAITAVTHDMFRKTGTTADDTEHFSEYPRMMSDIKVAAFFREIEDGWKVSLRSSGSVNVAGIALRFHGGGHKNAAGYKTKTDLKTAKASLLKAVAEATRG